MNIELCIIEVCVVTACVHHRGVIHGSEPIMWRGGSGSRHGSSGTGRVRASDESAVAIALMSPETSPPSEPLLRGCLPAQKLERTAFGKTVRIQGLERSAFGGAVANGAGL
jgi:hypothetical protein